MTFTPAPLTDDVNWFPDHARALDAPEGLLAIGGDLSSQRLLCAYQRGIFPWYGEGDPILWWSPDPRAVLPLDALHMSRSLRKTLKAKSFAVSFDHAFRDVIRACALPRRKSAETWITDEMVRAYTNLHEHEQAHSVEVWQDGVLVGGLYGVATGGVFSGESMFSLVSDASKMALCYLAKHLRDHNFVMLDCQIINPFLSQMGAVEIPRRQYLSILEQNTIRSASQGLWRINSETTRQWDILP